ncbi:histidine utilization repressor [Xanthomonas nasturtii]|uniref:Histidine utilization repressor n=1 Tax=Xanthomonas nasturtii TaxID=1843581 RepID=A0ABT0LX87_9XANT|nr:histidine utilization repressor [Xanthomonas nasturtii]MCL1499173.1 histidine utilization repressor [Xanthomonas nasturtii]MCL1502367.1 histidine utilization repressor [Xanthomonas nasturtii]MCL1522186.1 histidine utilization repressor [Xanthomonas nasturtii]MCL1525136.1 histidine utilization repressor [Xanthomonas nasturtii]MCL1531219.1 histidine utilization repressor [Xanthomonas nasturtii]
MTATTPLAPGTLHQRIRQDLEQRIHSGDWPPGHRVPPEHELMAQYGCSRMTVNKVLGLLADAGMIERRRRTGSFVARPHPHLEQVALSIPDIEVEMTTRGHVYRFALLSRQLRNVRQRVPQERALGSAGKVLALQSVHLADGRPFALEQRVIDISTVPEALEQPFTEVAPGSWLLRNVPWTRAEHRISAVSADAAQSEQLQVDEGAACLVIDRHTWRGEQPVTYVRQLFLGGSYDLVARFAPGMR